MLTGQDNLNYIGKNLKIFFEVIDNVGEAFRSCIVLRNDGDENISKGDWQIYSYHMCLTASECIEFDIDHVNGGLFKITPTDKFCGLKPGECFELSLTADESVITKYYVLPRWYVAQEGLKPVVIKSTDDETLSFVGDFDSPKKWKKRKKDKSNPFTPEERYKRYQIKDLGCPCKPVIPTPIKADFDDKKRINLSKGTWTIVTDTTEFNNEIAMLAEYLKISKNSQKGSEPRTHFIKVTRGDVVNEYNSDEAYEIKLDEERPSIEITAPSPAGLFYAIQTIFSLLETSMEKGDKILPSGYIKDAPRFPYRGMHMDVSRNFTPTDEVIKILKVIASYKMNKFHFHLTDDEGWRLEIKDLPELTEVGGKRDHVLASKGLAVEPTLGSGPDYKSSGSGFYSIEVYRHILQVASQHHIEVIPEIDMPGHCYAAVVAMAARYKKYKELGDMTAAEEYLLSDQDEKQSYASDQMYTGNTMNPCMDGSKRFVEKILTTLADLHEPIQPLKTFHVGGDEVPLGAWDSSPLCQMFYTAKKKEWEIEEELEENKKMTAKLQEHFMTFVEDKCKELDLQLAVWNDGIHDPTIKQESEKPMMVSAWRISQNTDRHNPYVLANSGFKVIISSATHTYFDHPYEPDPEENGLHWCVRKLEDMSVFGMKPYNMYACQENKSHYGHDKLRNKSAIVGIQSQIWRELVRTNEMLEYMLFPRMLALAERAWHEAPWESDEEVTSAQTEDWIKFANTVGYKELRRLEKCRIHYRIPPPGIQIDDDKLLINSLYPGLKFKCRKSGTEDWKECAEGSLSEFERKQSYEFVTSSIDQERTSRIILTPI